MTRGGNRPGAGRKPFGEVPLSEQLLVSVTPQFRNELLEVMPYSGGTVIPTARLMMEIGLKTFKEEQASKVAQNYAIPPTNEVPII